MTLLERVRRALMQLELLNETPVRGEGFEATGPVSGGKPEAVLPQPVETELDHFTKRLRRICAAVFGASPWPLGELVERTFMALNGMDKHDADYHTRRLSIWCHDAEERVHEQRKGQADAKGQLPEMTGDQVRFWVLKVYTGVEYRRVAKWLGVGEQQVYRMRQDRGREPRYDRTGRKLGEAA